MWSTRKHLQICRKYQSYIWDNVPKTGPSKICGIQSLKNLITSIFFIDFITQILLGPLLNTLSHLMMPTNQNLHFSKCRLRLVQGYLLDIQSIYLYISWLEIFFHKISFLIFKKYREKFSVPKKISVPPESFRHTMFVESF